MQIRDNFKRGAVEMIILCLLSSGDYYGYEMSMTIDEISGGYLNVPEGSMYPTLYKLEKKKMITSYKKTVKNNLRRVYYHLTEEGMDYLRELKREFFAVNDAIEKIIRYTEEKNQ